MTPEEYCLGKVARDGSSFYYSMLFLPQSQRRAITALYAYYGEINEVIERCTEPALARTKLDWWRVEIERLFNDQPRHPVARALSPLVFEFNLEQERFQAVINAVQVDMECEVYHNLTDLLTYCHQTSGIISLMTADICGSSRSETRMAVHDLGIGLQLLQFIDNIRKNIRNGHTYLPLDEMYDNGVSPSDLMATRTPNQVSNLIALQARRIEDYLQKGLDQIAPSDRYNQLGSIIMATLGLTRLREVKADGFRLLDHQIRLTPLRELWIAWRLARRLKRSRFTTSPNNH